MKKNYSIIFYFLFFISFNAISKTAIIYTDGSGNTYGVVLNYDLDCENFEPAEGITIVDCWNFLNGGGSSPGTGLPAISALSYEVYINNENNGGVIYHEKSSGQSIVLKSTNDIINDTDDGLNVHISNESGDVVVSSSTYDPFVDYTNLRVKHYTKNLIVQKTNESIYNVEQIVDLKPVNVNISPNPATNRFEINVTSYNNEMNPIELYIYSIDGRLMYNETINNNKIEINRNFINLKDGTYLLKLVRDGTIISESEKIILH